jgi:hypothetical protein
MPIEGLGWGRCDQFFGNVEVLSIGNADVLVLRIARPGAVADLGELDAIESRSAREGSDD